MPPAIGPATRADAGPHDEGGGRAGGRGCGRGGQMGLQPILRGPVGEIQGLILAVRSPRPPLSFREDVFSRQLKEPPKCRPRQKVVELAGRSWLASGRAGVASPAPRAPARIGATDSTARGCARTAAGTRAAHAAGRRFGSGCWTTPTTTGRTWWTWCRSVHEAFLF